MAGDQFDRPFEMASAPELSRLSDLAPYKEARLDEAMDQRMQHWEKDQPFATTGFDAPRNLAPEDWW